MADGRTGARKGPLATSLSGEAQTFADKLTRLLNGTVTTGADVTVFVHEGDELATVAPGAGERISDVQPVPLSVARSEDERRHAKLWMKLFFSVELDDEQQYLAVRTSMFGLCVNPETGFCPIRVEFDRYKTARQQAHVQVHGESSGLGYAYAAVGRRPKALDKLHFPVGGRRFRPTLEDFIEFLRQEDLLPQMKPGWQSTIEKSRGEWENKQVSAAVRRAPDVAADQLRKMGYEVLPPR